MTVPGVTAAQKLSSTHSAFDARSVRGIAGKAVRGGAVLMAARLIVQIFVWGVTLLVARLLTPIDYGVMTAGTLFIGLADLLAEVGIGRALVQKQDLRPADLAATFTFSLAISLVLYAVLVLGAGHAAAAMNVPPLERLLPVLGILVLITPLRAVPLALLDRELRLGRQAVVHVLCSVTQSLVVLGLALAGAGYWSLATGSILARLLECGMLLHAAGWRPRLAWPGRDQRGLFWFGIHASLSSLLWFIYSNADFAILGKISGPLILGYYALAFQIISLPVQKLTANANQVAYPVFCRLQHDPARLRDWYLRLTVLLGCLGAPSLIGLALVAPDAIGLVLGQRWLPTVVPFQLLSVVGVMMVYGSSLPPLLNSLGRPDINLRYTAVCALLFPAGFLVGAVFAGIAGVCIAWLILYPLVLMGLVILTRRITGIRLTTFIGAQLPVLSATIVMSVVVSVVNQLTGDLPWPWLHLLICIIAGMVSYVGSLLICGRRTVMSDLSVLLREWRVSQERTERE